MGLVVLRRRQRCPARATRADLTRAKCRLETFARSTARLNDFDAPPEANELHRTFSRALSHATFELKSEVGAGSTGATEGIVARLRATVHAANDEASLRTRLALEQFRSCESLLGD